MALPDVVVIGAGVVGAACAFYAAHAGLSVTVLDRGSIAGGTTGISQGGVLASDKPPGPALDLAVESLRRWEELGAEFGPARLGLARPGTLIVAGTEAEWSALGHHAERHRAANVDVLSVPTDELPDHEPLLSAALAGGVYYPGDLQVDPVRATAQLLRASGAEVRCGVDVRGIELTGGQRVAGVRTAGGERIGCATVINAAGVWAGEVSAMVGTPLPITPRQGYLLATEALSAARLEHTTARGAVPERRSSWPIRHTVCTALNPAENTVRPRRAPATPVDPGPSRLMMTGGRAGSVLVGATREKVTVDSSWPVPVLRDLASQAVTMFPCLAGVCVLRADRAFQPGTPDRLPIIGPDLWIAGLYHAGGHSGSGVGLAPATGALTASMITSEGPVVDPFPFHPERFG